MMGSAHDKREILNENQTYITQWAPNAIKGNRLAIKNVPTT
jgi:hypothetical protein